MRFTIATPPASITCAHCEQEINDRRSVWRHTATNEVRCSN